MQDAKHTPGPWIAASYYDGMETLAVTAGSASIASVIMQPRGTPDDVPEALANARVIAAAPRMLEALRLILGQLEHADPTDKAAREARAIARAVIAIAAAMGEE
jgi:hypothetical protein